MPEKIGVAHFEKNAVSRSNPGAIGKLRCGVASRGLLALCTVLTLLITLYADFKLYCVYSNAREQLGSLFGEQTGNQISAAANPFELGIGAYVTLIVAAYLALRGIQRYSSDSTWQMISLFGQVSASSSTFDLSIGAYVALIVAAYIAFRGILRYRKRPAAPPIA